MILVCGEALIDLFAQETDGELATQAVAGGSPFNVAIALARLGRRTGFLSTLSNDAFGGFLAARLAREGVEQSYLRRCPEPTTLSVVATDAQGEPHYSFYAQGCADRALSIANLPPVLPEDVHAIAAGSYALGVDPAGHAIATLLRRESKRFISLDPNVRPRVVGDVAAFAARFERLVATATLVKASMDDLALLHPGGDAAAVARSWLARGPLLVVVTRGAQGALAFLRDGTLVTGHAPVVDVIDTVGAGDSFHAALLAHFDAQGRLSREAFATLMPSDIKTALAFATNAAAIACTRRGANPASWAEVEDSFRHCGASKARARNP